MDEDGVSNLSMDDVMQSLETAENKVLDVMQSAASAIRALSTIDAINAQSEFDTQSDAFVSDLSEIQQILRQVISQIGAPLYVENVSQESLILDELSDQKRSFAKSRIVSLTTKYSQFAPSDQELLALTDDEPWTAPVAPASSSQGIPYENISSIPAAKAEIELENADGDVTTAAVQETLSNTASVPGQLNVPGAETAKASPVVESNPVTGTENKNEKDQKDKSKAANEAAAENATGDGEDGTDALLSGIGEVDFDFGGGAMDLDF